MFWADKLLQSREGKEWVNDAWTPSGIVHMGGLKGPVIHDTLFRIIKEQGREVKFTFGFDDFDPIDGLPKELLETHERYLGFPIFKVPSPSGKGSFGDYYGNMMRDLFKQLKIQAEIYLASDYYKKGIYNKAIEYALDNVNKVRKVYEDMYKKKMLSDWYPIQVICPNCGKLGTTKVIGWDGKEVTFSCEPDLVKWAKGCGAKGKISPFDGNAKMPWKVEWAAKWWTFGVTIEAAGKDHASAGGSYDIAMKICEDVFNCKPPLKLPYEFFLWNGKKMASSKGIGLTGGELLEVIPPEICRFLMIKTEPNTAVEFNPHQNLIIPKLYDDYQKAELEKERAYELSQINGGKIPKIRFITLAQWVQMPNMENQIKKGLLEEWAEYAKIWIERFAPEDQKFTIQTKLPKEVEKLSKEQRQVLLRIAKELDKKWQAEDFQTKIYDIGKEIGLNGAETFEAIYLSLLGKNHGPKAAWLILSLDREFIKKRFLELSNTAKSLGKRKAQNKKLNNPEIFSIDAKVTERSPSIVVGIAIIKGVSIKKTDDKLEKEKDEVLKSLKGLTTEQLSQYPEIQSYRRLYRETGIDWHSRRPSPEALLRRIALQKGLYTVNTCVDAYNLIVMKHRVSVGAFDLDKIQFPTVLRFSKTGEEIHLLGEERATKYKEGELAYFDKKGGYNMDFNYRDAQRTAVQSSTKNLYVNVDGIYDIKPDLVEKVLQEVCDTIVKYCGGKITEFGIEHVF